MTTLFELHSSINGDNSRSSALVRDFVAAWRERHPGGKVITRDTNAEPIPHINATRFGAFLAPDEERSAEQKEIVAYSDALIAEIRAADVLVLGVPMYNFMVPSTFKAWMDHVARAGVTFKYTENGPVGLLEEGKRAIVISARGGYYAGTDNDNHTPLLRQYLGFLGIKDVEFVYAEGQNMGEEAAGKTFREAQERIGELVGATAAS